MATRKSTFGPITARIKGKDYAGTWHLAGRGRTATLHVELPGVGKKATQVGGLPVDTLAGQLLREIVRQHQRTGKATSPTPKSMTVKVKVPNGKRINERLMPVALAIASLSSDDFELLIRTLLGPLIDEVVDLRMERDRLMALAE